MMMLTGLLEELQKSISRRNSSMEYKVCIMAAGKGNRAPYSDRIHNALLPVGYKASISKIIEKFPEETEIIIAVGHRSSQVRDFVQMAHKNRKITFVEIEKFDGSGSGPGYSLLQCKPYLQCPFIFTSCDTIVLEHIPEPNKNWIGVAHVQDSKDYCMAEVINENVKRFYDKVDTPSLFKICLDYRTILNNGFIGMAGVYDYKSFWNGLEKTSSTLIKNELQVSNGLNELIPRRLEAVPFTWFDTGEEASYEYAKRYFGDNKVLAKPDEFIYFEEDVVIKYFADPKIAENRAKRAVMLKEVIPELVDWKPNFYAYKYVDGITLPQSSDKVKFRKMLEHFRSKLWKPATLDIIQQQDFRRACIDVYEAKTKRRISEFFEREKIQDSREIINGVEIPRIDELLGKLDWNYLSSGVPVLFHGDFQPENIIINEKGDGWTLLDWRHDFGKIIEYGDIYYDFIKMHHALLICGEIIRDNQFKVEKNGNAINYDFLVKGNLLEFEKVFENFISENQYDLNKVRMLSAITYLNIAACHHNPYSLLLFYLGKSQLYELLKTQGKI